MQFKMLQCFPFVAVRDKAVLLHQRTLMHRGGRQW